MKKVPYAFQNAVRREYFDLLKRFTEDQGLTPDLQDHEGNKDDVIIVNEQS